MIRFAKQLQSVELVPMLKRSGWTQVSVTLNTGQSAVLWMETLDISELTDHTETERHQFCQLVSCPSFSSPCQTIFSSSDLEVRCRVKSAQPVQIIVITIAAKQRGGRGTSL